MCRIREKTTDIVSRIWITSKVMVSSQPIKTAIWHKKYIRSNSPRMALIFSSRAYDLVSSTTTIKEVWDRVWIAITLAWRVWEPRCRQALWRTVGMDKLSVAQTQIRLLRQPEWWRSTQLLNNRMSYRRDKGRMQENSKRREIQRLREHQRIHLRWRDWAQPWIWVRLARVTRRTKSDSFASCTGRAPEDPQAANSTLRVATAHN